MLYFFTIIKDSIIQAKATHFGLFWLIPRELLVVNHLMIHFIFKHKSFVAVKCKMNVKTAYDS